MVVITPRAAFLHIRTNTQSQNRELRGVVIALPLFYTKVVKAFERIEYSHTALTPMMTRVSYGINFQESG